MVVGTRIHARFLRCALLCTVFAIYSIYSLRYGEDSRAFVGGSSTASSTGSLVVMHAYKPILRRDPILNKELQTWMRQQLRLVKRQEAGGFSNTVDRKKLYLQKLGLDKKAEELDQKQFRPPWHLKHVVAGDKFVGTFQHPDLYRGEVLDLTFEASSDTEANIFSKRGDLDDTVTLQQDYPIAFESGEQKDNDASGLLSTCFFWGFFGSHEFHTLEFDAVVFKQVCVAVRFSYVFCPFLWGYPRCDIGKIIQMGVILQALPLHMQGYGSLHFPQI